jgi:hypothetical protein
MVSNPRLSAMIPAAGLLVLACNSKVPGDGDLGTTEGESTDASTGATDTSGTDTTGDGDGDGDTTGDGDGDTTGDGDGDTTGDGDGDGSHQCDNPGGPLQDFHIINVSPAEGTTLTLTFSEPVGPLEGVDPDDFRISMAMTFYAFEYGQAYQSSQYTDLVVYANIYPYVNFTFLSITPGASPDQVVLELDQPFPDYACEYIAYFNNLPPPTGGCAERTLLLHHAGGDVPIHDVDGVALPDFGPDWVHEPSWVDYVEDAGFPNFPARIDIPCP